MQRLQWFSVDELDLAVVLAVPSPSCAALQAANDHVDRPLGLLEWVVRIACLRRGRRVKLIATVLRLVAITSSVVTAVVVLEATSVVTEVVVVSM
jgi:hypothetical protein